MLVRLLVAGMLLAVGAVVAGDQVYKWVDASGNVTYSSTPPPGAAAQPVDLPPVPPAAEIEAARQREHSLQELGDQLSQDRLDREAQLAEERKAARAEAALQPPVQPVPDPGIDADSGWWIPAYPGYWPGDRPPGSRPVLPGRPVRPPPGRNPTHPLDDPVYWPREPVLPPAARPGTSPRPWTLPSGR